MIDVIPYILEFNPRPFYIFKGLKYQMRITITCGLDSRSRAGFWKKKIEPLYVPVRTIQYNNLLFYLLLIIVYYSSDSPSSLITESLSVFRRDCARLLIKTRFTVTGMTHRPPGVASDFNASVISDIIQSPCGQGAVEGKVRIRIAN
jgi:hypothetical protein